MTRRLRFHRAVATAVVCSLPAMPLGADEGHVDLLGLMGTLQTLVHKTQLAIDAGNLPLAGFYAHEIEEATEALSEVAAYDDHPIGTLTAATLAPAVDALDEALNRGDLPGVAERANVGLDRVIGSCNACHAATGHGFIVIERNSLNPYAQRFEAR